MSEPTPEVDAADGHGSLLTLALLSLLVGLGTGLVGAAFRLALEEADRLRNALIVWAHGSHWEGAALVTAVISAAAALSSWLVCRFAPTASGSGIPQVEAVLQGQAAQASFHLIPIKFVGGLLAIGAGLALGREGPSVQMGASIGERLGRSFRRNWPDCRVLIAAGAGAGDRGGTHAARRHACIPCRCLELRQRRDPAALFCAGDRRGPACDTLQPRAARDPGGGDPITQRTLTGTEGLTMVPLVFLVRFGLGTVSYAARTPGGLFAPLLVLGAQLGLMFGGLCRFIFPSFQFQPEEFAIVGMAALFTGIVLVVEMTASVRMLLPMLGACFTAMLVPTLLRGAPIYESLRAAILRQAAASRSSSNSLTRLG